MSEIERGGLDLKDEDRLPWLEAVEPEEVDDGVSPARVMAGVTAALAALGLVIGGIWWMRDRSGEQQGDGSLIAAPAGDYKEKPADAGGMEVEGQGDASFAASDGAEANGAIDTSAMPEAPMVTEKPAAPVVSAAAAPAKAMPEKAAPPKPKPVVVAKADVGGTLTAAKPAKPVPAPVVPVAAGGGSVIQLGAFASEAGANQAWAGLSKRFAFLSGLSKTVTAGTSGSATVYRLRAAAPSAADAKSLCSRLKVAGENCLVVAN